MDHYNKLSPDEYLIHHGIKGQQWGVRNGPPYPLGASDHSASEKKAGWQKSLDKRDNTDNNKRKVKIAKEDNTAKKSGLTDSQKRAIKIGAAVVATALVAYGTYKLADSGELHRLTEKGKVFVNGSSPKWLENQDFSNPNMTADEIYHRIVPLINYDQRMGGMESLGTNNNCRRCTFAYEICRRGYQVQATHSLAATGQNAIGVYNATHDNPLKGGRFGAVLNTLFGDNRLGDYFETSLTPNGMLGTQIKIDSKAKATSIFEALSKNPNGARGELTVKFKQMAVQHSMAWEIIKGKAVIYDCQQSLMFNRPEVFSYLAEHVEDASFLRLDNVELNNDFLLRWVKNFGS